MATYSSSIVINAFFSGSCKDSKRTFGHIAQDERAPYPFFFALLRICHKHHYDLRVPIFSSEYSRHLLQSAQGSSLVTYASTLPLWCLLEQYDHAIRFTWTRTRVEKSKMEIWNTIWPVNGLCDLDYSFNLSVMLLSMRVAAIYCGYSFTFPPLFFSPQEHKGSHPHTDGARGI